MTHGSIAERSRVLFISLLGPRPWAMKIPPLVVLIMNHTLANYYLSDILINQLINWYGSWPMARCAGRNTGVASLGSEPWVLSYERTTLNSGHINSPINYLTNIMSKNSMAEGSSGIATLGSEPWALNHERLTTNEFSNKYIIRELLSIDTLENQSIETLKLIVLLQISHERHVHMSVGIALCIFIVRNKRPTTTSNVSQLLVFHICLTGKFPQQRHRRFSRTNIERDHWTSSVYRS